MINIVKKLSIVIAIQFFILNQIFALFGSEQSDVNLRTVAVIINSELYPQVKESIDRYVDDLKREGYEVVFFEWDCRKIHRDYVEELKSLLKDCQQNHNIQGAVLIGMLPYALGKIGTPDNIESGPLDTYLMHFNSKDFIQYSNGDIIGYEGSLPINLDIWVSRICAPQNSSLFPGISEAELVKNYFEKNHAYRICQTPVPDLKVKFHAAELSTGIVNGALEYLNSWKNFYYYLSESGYPSDYLDFVKNNPAQYLSLYAHSEVTAHTFMVSDKEFTLESKEMSGACIKQSFILMNACSACEFLDSESLGNAYLFGPDSSALVIAGLAMPGNLLDVHFLHSNGKNFGNNAVSAFNAKELYKFCLYILESVEALSSYADNEQSKIYKVQIEDLINKLRFSAGVIGFTLLGDPTLKPYINMDWCPE